MNLISSDDSCTPIPTQLLQYNQTLDDCFKYTIANEQHSFPTPFTKQTLHDVVAFSQAISNATHQAFQFRDALHAIKLLDAAQFFNNQLLELASTHYLIEQWRSLAPNDVPDHIKHYLLFHIPGLRVLAFIQHFYQDECHRQLQLDYIHQRYKLDDLVIAEDKDVFENETVEKLVSIDTNIDGRSSPEVVAAFQHLCCKGHLRSLKWLTDQFRLIVDDARSDNNYAFRWAAENGHLPVLQWLTDHFHLTVDDAKSLNNSAFRSATYNGHLPVLQWLTDHFQLTVDDARSGNNLALRLAAENGHLPILQWLTDHFHLTVDDTISGNNCAFRSAVFNGHLPVLQWLTDHFHLTVDDARSDNNWAFQWAAQKGHPHVLQWLTEHFPLTADDARSRDNLAFRWAAEKGHLHVLQWLTDHFHLTADDARSVGNNAFRLAAQNGHIHVLQWLGERFGIHE